MLVTLACHQGDAASALDLLRWIAQLGPCNEHNLCIVADASVQWSTGLELIALGNKAFKSTGLITTRESVQGWPKGANALWRLAAQHCKDYHTAFLWLEPDCVPLKAIWLRDIQQTYNECHKPFLGRIYSVDQPGMPKKMMSGIGVYPENAIDLLGTATESDKAWDVMAAETIVPLAEHTRLIHHFWGQENLAPTFASVRTQHSPINTFTLDMVDPMSVVFHRNKNGTLINLLRKKMFPELPDETSLKFDVVLPFCATDAELALENVKWMAELSGHYDHTIILAIDEQSRLVNEILHITNAIFNQTIVFKYPLPPVQGHPQAANWAFRHVARWMQQRGRPWLWMEPDMVALKPEWLDVLQREYEMCGKPCMGPVVMDMNHANGTCIYCADLPNRCPRFMEFPDGHWAFDMVIKDELMPILHDASHLMQLAWCMAGNQLLPYGHGELPEFRHRGMLSQLWPSAVTFHRCKSTSLIDRLREQRHRIDTNPTIG